MTVRMLSAPAGGQPISQLDGQILVRHGRKTCLLQQSRHFNPLPSSLRFAVIPSECGVKPRQGMSRFISIHRTWFIAYTRIFEGNIEILGKTWQIKCKCNAVFQQMRDRCLALMQRAHDTRKTTPAGYSVFLPDSLRSAPAPSLFSHNDTVPSSVEALTAPRLKLHASTAADHTVWRSHASALWKPHSKFWKRISAMRSVGNPGL